MGIANSQDVNKAGLPVYDVGKAPNLESGMSVYDAAKQRGDMMATSEVAKRNGGQLPIVDTNHFANLVSAVASAPRPVKKAPGGLIQPNLLAGQPTARDQVSAAITAQMRGNPNLRWLGLSVAQPRDDSLIVPSTEPVGIINRARNGAV